MGKQYSYRKEVFCQLDIEGVHHWPDCPLTEVSYLKHPHRHLFHIQAYKDVSHNNRDTEFIVLKHEIYFYLVDNYYDSTYKICDFGSSSCEMIAEELIEEFDLSSCSVSEDKENGALITVINVEEQ